MKGKKNRENEKRKPMPLTTRPIDEAPVENPFPLPFLFLRSFSPPPPLLYSKGGRREALAFSSTAISLHLGFVRLALHERQRRLERRDASGLGGLERLLHASSASVIFRASPSWDGHGGGWGGLGGVEGGDGQHRARVFFSLFRRETKLPSSREAKKNEK